MAGFNPANVIITLPKTITGMNVNEPDFSVKSDKF